MRVDEVQSIQIKLASPEEILSWSHGEVTRPETINYRTLRSEKDGLFCEKIFGPTKDYQCYCGKYRRIRYKGVICDRCGVEVTKSAVRRSRMGHIKLATPVSHIWFLRGIPSRMGMILNISREKLEKVVYWAAYIITSVNSEAQQRVLENIEREYQSQVKTTESQIKNKTELKEALEGLAAARVRARLEIQSIRLHRTLSEIGYRDFSFKYGEVFEAETGAEALYKIFQEVDLKKEIKKLKQEFKEAPASKRQKISRRLRFFEGVKKAGIRPENMFLIVLPVLPPDLRPMVQLDGGRYASSDLNDLYRRVINRNNRLKYLLEIAAPEVIVRNEKRMLQEAVDALIDNGMRKSTTILSSTGGTRRLKSLADMLKGKQGRFRQNLLGKRVDYSGRSVIVVGPELRLGQIGIPKEMALELFKPFVVERILKQELAFNIRGASRLIEQETDEVWAILEEVVQDKFVLANRAPTLHRLGIQAFQPKLIEGKAIQLHPLVCSAYNADFDGDQMAIHVPLSSKAQAEAREIMLSTQNLLKPGTGRPITNPSQDIILGCYWLSRPKAGAKGEGRIFSDFQEAVLAAELGEVDRRAKIKVFCPPGKGPSGFLETTVGKIIFNQSLPGDFPFQNEVLDNRRLEKITWELIERYGPEKAARVLDRIKELGFEYSTLSGLSLGIDDFQVPPEKKGIIQDAEQEIEKINQLCARGLLSEEERIDQAIEVWSRAKSRVEEILPRSLPSEGAVFMIADSGCRGSWVQPLQMAGMRGLMVNPLGEVIELPVKNSFKEGLGVLEYFISTHGARKGTSDTALRTAQAGYLTRRLVDMAHEVMISEENCGDQKGTTLFLEDASSIGQDFFFKIGGRVAVSNIKLDKKTLVKKGKVIGWREAEQIIQAKVAEVNVFSPLSCQSLRGICQKCYGWDLGRDEMIKIGQAVGIIAAQAIGEPGTQLVLRTFHTGGVAGGADITSGLPRVNEIFEVRVPKGQAVLSQVEGRVTSIKNGLVRIKTSAAKGKPAKAVGYRIPKNLGVWVEAGERVKKGDQLCEGNLDLRELFKNLGREATQRHIVSGNQKVYVSHGAKIHDKHLEVIARQMFSRIRIRDAGESRFAPGEIVSRGEFSEENERVGRSKKKLAEGKEILSGITRVALTTDSFLSAASFQSTSRVLIEAALEGKEDWLRGLKENVLIGKLISAGTGYKP